MTSALSSEVTVPDEELKLEFELNFRVVSEAAVVK